MSKGKFKNWKIILFSFCLVSMMLFTFALPCSAEQRILYNVNDLNLTANYVVESGLDYGNRVLSYEGSVRPGSITFQSYGNCPFNISSPSVTTENYSISVDIDGISPTLTSSSNKWNVTTRIAIGNGSSIFNFPDSFEVRLYSKDGVWITNLNYQEIGNVAYVNDDISINANSTYKIQLFFGFGELYSSNSADAWSNATHLYLYRFQFARPDDWYDVGQEIINSTTDKNIQAQENVENYKVNAEIFEKDVFDSFSEVFSQIPDISTYDEEIEDTIFLSNILSSCFLGLGDGFTVVWWVAVTVGILCTFIGLLINGGKKK